MIIKEKKSAFICVDPRPNDYRKNLVVFFFLFLVTISSYSFAQEDDMQVEVVAGEFVYGFAKGSKKVYLDRFYMDRYELTNIEYSSFVSETGHRKPLFADNANLNAPFQPVVGVDWQDAVSFCKWRGGHLPSDTEWEKAAGWDEQKQRSYIYPWGDEWNLNKLNTFEHKIGKSTIVGHFVAGKNHLGLYDMAGNVWEWVNDWYTEGVKKIVRGGSWGNKYNQDYSMVFYKGGTDIDLRLSTHGFRCVEDVKK